MRRSGFIYESHDSEQYTCETYPRKCLFKQCIGEMKVSNLRSYGFPQYNLILPVVLYGCETWSLTLMEEHRLRVFEKRILRRIFGPRRDEVTGGW
jgi:hypothetical protein